MENVISDKNNMMAHGSVPKTFAKLAVPAIIAQVVNLLYNIVDRIYIGHIPEVGGSALTGLGLFVPILMLISAFAGRENVLSAYEEAVRERYRVFSFGDAMYLEN